MPEISDELFAEAAKAYCQALPGFPSDAVHGDLSADAVGFRAALAVAFAAGRKAAAQDVKNMSHELGDEGWDEMCRRAEKAGYDRSVVLRRRRGDFTTTNVEAAYQVGRDFAARVAAGGQ